MKKYKQLLKHDPANNVFGDCDRTTVACLLNLHPSKVPHWGENFNDPVEFNRVKDLYLQSMGLRLVRSAYDGVDALQTVLNSVGWLNPNTYYLLTGTSKIGVDHVVICLNQEIYWDPSPTDNGIVGPASDGYWHIEFLASAHLRHEPDDAPV